MNWAPFGGGGGLAIDREECFPGLGCVGLAVRGLGGPVAAISVVGDGRSPLELVAPLVVDAVRAVSDELFGTTQPCRRPISKVAG